MGSWMGSTTFVLFNALFGCGLGFGIAAMYRAYKDRKNKEKDEAESDSKKG